MHEPTADFTCVECGGVVEPFGKMRHWFGDDNNLLCVSCARAIMPERVAIAEAFEAEWNATATKPETRNE